MPPSTAENTGLHEQALSSPEQLSADVLRAEAVVFPVGQLWHTGVGVEALPPADHEPAAHSRQPASPNPGRHTAHEP